MSTTNVSIRMDATLKQQTEQLLNDMGMNMTTAVTIFAKAIVREGRIPFEIKADPFYNPQNLERLTRAAREMDAGVHTNQHDLLEAN